MYYTKYVAKNYDLQSKILEISCDEEIRQMKTAKHYFSFYTFFSNSMANSTCVSRENKRIEKISKIQL